MFKTLYVFLAFLTAAHADLLKKPTPPQVLSEGLHSDEVRKLEDLKKEVSGLHSLLDKAKACSPNHPQKTQVDFKQKIKEATKMLKAIDKDIKNKKIDLRIIDTRIDEFYQKLDELKCIDFSSSESLPDKSSLQGADVRYNPPVRRRSSDKRKENADHTSDKGGARITYQYSDLEQNMASEESVLAEKNTKAPIPVPRKTPGSSQSREEAIIGG